MSTIGESLKKEREFQGLSLKDVEKATSIRQRYLEAIENGCYSLLPGEVYTKGFIRNYAIVLGFDGDDFVSRYKLETEIQELKEKANNSSEQYLSTNQQQKQSSQQEILNDKKTTKKIKILPFVIASCFIVVVSIGAYVAFNFAQTPVVTNKQNNLATITPPNLVVDSSDKKEQTNFTIINDKKGNIVIVPDRGQTIDNISLDVEFNDSCWTRVIADGTEIYSGILNKGNKSTWQAKETIFVKFGNVYGAKMQVNKQQIDVISEAGPVAETSITIAK